MEDEIPPTPAGYSLILASDVSTRDGLGLELYGATGEMLAEVFRDDIEGTTTLRIEPGGSLELHIAQWFVGKARELLL